MSDIDITVTHTADWDNHHTDGEFYLAILGYTATVTGDGFGKASRYTVVGPHNNVRQSVALDPMIPVSSAKTLAENTIRSMLLDRSVTHDVVVTLTD